MSDSPSVYNIPTSEFETKRHVFDLWLWINAKLKEMEAKEDFDTIYFERKGENVKKLLEEAVPVAFLGLYLFRMADDVYIQCKAGNQPFDALLDVVGFRNFSIKVEVTVTEDIDSTLRRQSLSRTGFTYFTGPIRKEKGQIISEPEMVDTHEEEQKLSELAYERFLQKVESGKYDKDTAILVYVASTRPLPLSCRAELVSKTHKYLLANHPAIYGVYYYHRGVSAVDEVRESDYWHD